MLEELPEDSVNTGEGAAQSGLEVPSRFWQRHVSSSILIHRGQVAIVTCTRALQFCRAPLQLSSAMADEASCGASVPDGG